MSPDGPQHVHGLGTNPSDGALFVATHTGLFRAAPASTTATRVGQSEQDTMGFTVVGRDHFLGSGHPSPGENRPPLLGLIESRDAGKTWTAVSLLGEADFHILRSAHGNVYGFDAANGRLLVSRDAGKTWARRAAPEPLIDLAVDPKDPRGLIAAGQRGLWRSRDQGRTWSAVAPQVGLLAWPVPRRLYLVDARGVVSVSANGARWRPVGQIGGPPAAFAASNARQLYAAQSDGTIKRSADGGESWALRASP